MSEKFRIDRKISFQNTFYTKCINVIIYRIGPSIILRSIYTPASNLGYLAPPRTIFHGCQIVHWDPLDGKRRCPLKKIGLGYVKIAWFLWQPIANLRRGVCLQNYSYLTCYLS